VLSDGHRREQLAVHATARLSKYSWRACAERQLAAMSSQL
jgi:hypothetical protein